jgi:hypothetical protein
LDYKEINQLQYLSTIVPKHLHTQLTISDTCHAAAAKHAQMHKQSITCPHQTPKAIPKASFLAWTRDSQKTKGIQAQY